MARARTFRWILGTILVLLFSSNPTIRSIHAAPPQAASLESNCDHLPNTPSYAGGIERQCPAVGSSSGVAKGDFNGDGVADLAIGVPGSRIGGMAAVGLVQVIYGSANGLTTNTTGIPKPQTFSQFNLSIPNLPAPAGGDRFGTALASGDFNGDGYSDLAIGIPGKVIPGSLFGGPASMGAIVLVYGSAGGLDTTKVVEYDFTTAIAKQQIILPSLPLLASFDFSRAQLGASLAWGFFNQDGSSDLVAGAPNLSISTLGGLNTVSSVGGVWEILSPPPPGIINPYVYTQLWTQGSLNSSLTDNAGDHFGASLAAGDFDGDGFNDIAIGIPYKTVGTATDAGMVVVLGGNISGLDTHLGGYCELSEGSLAKSGDHFGIALIAGDFDGDSKSDLAIGVPQRAVSGIAQAGVVYVAKGDFIGSMLLNQEWDQDLLAGIAETGDQFGSALAANDFNGDGNADLAIGVPHEGLVINGVNVVNAGEVDVIYGSNNGLSTTRVRGPQVWTESAPVAGAQFGAPLTAWNFGRNELTGSFPLFIPRASADLAVGIPYATVNGLPGAGAINVIYGSYISYGNGLVSTGRQTLTQQTFGVTPDDSANFGKAIY